MENILSTKVIPSSYVITALTLLDALSTIILVQVLGIASEANPLANIFLSHSVWSFMLIKCGITALFVTILQFMASSNPKRAHFYGWASVVLFTLVYVVGSIRINL